MEDRAMGTFPILETAHLRLRQPRESDSQQLLAITQDESVMRYYGMEPFTSEQEALKEIDWFNNQFRKSKGIRWVITNKQQDEYIGDVGFGYVQQHSRADLGFKLARAYWRQAIMTEAINLVIAYGFKTLQVNRLEAIVDPRNAACVGLLETFQFKKEGLLREYEFEKGDVAFNTELRPCAQTQRLLNGVLLEVRWRDFPNQARIKAVLSVTTQAPQPSVWLKNGENSSNRK
jgi:ribosomal-protein-alanine N-acetyltransferase